jgi:hypothetical protein
MERMAPFSWIEYSFLAMALLMVGSVVQDASCQ